MDIVLVALIIGLGLWVLVTLWAERRFQRLAKGHDYKRIVVRYNFARVETDDPYVRRIWRQRQWTMYGSYAVIAIVLLILFPNA